MHCAHEINAPNNGIPYSPISRLDGEIVGIWQSTIYVKNPSPRALLDVNTPIYRQESIQDW